MPKQNYMKSVDGGLVYFPGITTINGKPVDHIYWKFSQNDAALIVRVFYSDDVVEEFSLDISDGGTDSETSETYDGKLDNLKEYWDGNLIMGSDDP